MALLGGEHVGLPRPVDVLALAQRHGRASNLASVISFYVELLLGGLPSPTWAGQILAALDSKPAAAAENARRAVALILASPEAQVC